MSIDGLLIARINDAISITQKSGKPKFVGFIELQTAIELEAMLRKSGVKYAFFGGYPSANRVFVGTFPDYVDLETAEKLFPIDRIRIKNKSKEPISHRDVLGALMSCGIERETIGDISVSDSVVFFADKNVTKHLLGQIDKIRNCGVELFLDTEEFIPPEDVFVEKKGTVSSARVDCVVAEIIGTSRSKAAELINKGLVAINGRVAEKLTTEVCEGEKLTVKGKGKFIISKITDRTAKGRLVLIYKIYS